MSRPPMDWPSDGHRVSWGGRWKPPSTATTRSAMPVSTVTSRYLPRHEDLRVEPSAAAGLPGPQRVLADTAYLERAGRHSAGTRESHPPRLGDRRVDGA